MKNFYRTCVMLLVLVSSTISISVADDVNSFKVTPVGLHTDYVRMSNLELLEVSYMAPAMSIINAVSNDIETPFLNTAEEEGAQYIGGGLVFGSEIQRLGLQVMYLYYMTATIAPGRKLYFFLSREHDV